MIYLIDTGVLLRAVDPNDSHWPEIERALRFIHARGYQLVTTTQNLREFWNVSTRPQTARGGYGRTLEEATDWLNILRSILTIVGETPSTFDIWYRLVETHRVLGIQAHDAHLVALMKSHEIENILTLNSKDFHRYSGIRIFIPAEIGAGS